MVKRFICLDEDAKVISVRLGAEILEGEIESTTGECGQIRQTDGIFITPEPALPTEPTIADKINYIYYKNRGII